MPDKGGQRFCVKLNRRKIICLSKRSDDKAMICGDYSVGCGFVSALGIIREQGQRDGWGIATSRRARAQTGRETPRGIVQQSKHLHIRTIFGTLVSD